MPLEELNSQKIEYINQNMPKSALNSPKKTPEEIEEWLVNYIAQLLEIEPDEIDITVPYERYGLDSAEGITLTGDLDEWLEESLDPSLLYDYPTIEALVKYLTE